MRNTEYNFEQITLQHGDIVDYNGPFGEFKSLKINSLQRTHYSDELPAVVEAIIKGKANKGLLIIDKPENFTKNTFRSFLANDPITLLVDECNQTLQQAGLKIEMLITEADGTPKPIARLADKIYLADTLEKLEQLGHLKRIGRGRFEKVAFDKEIDNSTFTAKFKVGDKIQHDEFIGTDEPVWEIKAISDNRYYLNKEKTHWFEFEQNDNLVLVKDHEED